MNWAIVAALFAQAFISKASQLLGAIASFFITTGILVWGLESYSKGRGIGILGAIAIPQGVFIGACVVWYLFDIAALRKALVHRKFMNDPLINTGYNLNFIQNTSEAWVDPEFAELKKLLLQEDLNPATFLESAWPASENSCLGILFHRFPPNATEFLIGCKETIRNPETGEEPAVEFIVTNSRVVVCEKSTGDYTQFLFVEIESLEKSESGSDSYALVLGNGESISSDSWKEAPPEWLVAMYITAESAEGDDDGVVNHNGQMFVPLEGEGGQAFCHVCRQTDDEVNLLHCKEEDLYSHRGCLKQRIVPALPS
jgi:hypothetical protein